MSDLKLKYTRTPDGYKKKPGLRRWLIRLGIILIIISLGYLTGLRFFSEDENDIARLLSQKQWHQAYQKSLEALQQKNNKRLHYLMYASVAARGMAAEGLYIEGMQTQMRLLMNEDVNKAFVHESLMLQGKLLAHTPEILSIACDYASIFHQKIHNKETAKKWAQWVRTRQKLNPVNNECFNTILDPSRSWLKENLFMTTGSNLQMRESPSLNADVITRLEKNTALLGLSRGEQMIVGSHNAHWFYVLAPGQLQGWVYGAYISKAR